MKKITSKEIKAYVFEIIFFGLLICIDQFSKISINKYFMNNDHSIIPIEGILEFTVLINTGSAFGLLEGQKWFFISTAIVFIGIIMFILFRIPLGKHYLALRVSMIMILTGILGNMIDRIAYDGVIDFIYISCIKFPIFNFADIYITLSTLLLLILLIFVYKEKDFSFLYLKSQKFREIK